LPDVTLPLDAEGLRTEVRKPVADLANGVIRPQSGPWLTGPGTCNQGAEALLPTITRV
jgi:hypothetical protein